MSNWIKFADRKPPEKTLLFYFFNLNGRGIGIGEFEEPNVFFGKLGFLTGDVTHWMFAEDILNNAKTIDLNLSYPELFILISDDNDFNIGSAHYLSSNELIFVNLWGKQIINPVRYCYLPEKPSI